jgi:hypothetical protein
MCPRRQKESTLPTYRGVNGSREASDGEAAWSMLEVGEGALRCSFGTDGSSGSGGDDGWPSCKQQLGSGGLDSVGRWHELKRLWRLGFGWKKMLGKASIYRGRVQCAVLGL